MARSLTPATQYLKQHDIRFDEHSYAYVENGGTRVSAEALGVDEHCVIKTLVLEDENKKPMIVLMHGDRKVSEKTLARAIGAKKVQACNKATAERHSGYKVGGTSPFGLRKPMPIYVEASILDLPRIYINGGGRGYLVSLVPSVLSDLLGAQSVHCALV